MQFDLLSFFLGTVVGAAGLIVALFVTAFVVSVVKSRGRKTVE